MRCGIYVRVSTDDQRDNGYSIDSQLKMIKEYCEKNDYDIVDVYNDAGHSGKDLMRPEMQRLLKDIKFTDEFITKSSKEYLKYLNNIMNDNNIEIKFHKEIDEIELKNMESNYDILSIKKMKRKEYFDKFLEEFITKSQEHIYIDGIVSCPYTEKNVIKDILILVPKNELINTI